MGRESLGALPESMAVSLKAPSTSNKARVSLEQTARPESTEGDQYLDYSSCSFSCLLTKSYVGQRSETMTQKQHSIPQHAFLVALPNILHNQGLSKPNVLVNHLCPQMDTDTEERNKPSSVNRNAKTQLGVL